MSQGKTPSPGSSPIFSVSSTVEKEYILYKITNLVNGKYYIGKTTLALKKRWSAHKAHAKYGPKYSEGQKKSVGMTYLHRSMRKYGINNFEIKKIDSARDFYHQCFLENFYIGYYQSTNPTYGYNLIHGYGDGSNYISDATRTKIRFNSHIKNPSRKGVTWDRHRQKWVLSFCFGDVKIKKRYKNKDDAILTRDLLSLHFYKEPSALIFPEKIEEYKKINIEPVLAELTRLKEVKRKYSGVTQGKNSLYMARIQVKDKRVYLGSYPSEEEAALIRDKVNYYLYGESVKLNFPEKMTETYLEEGKHIYNLYSDPTRQKIIKGGKTSKFNGVSRRSEGTWEMSFGLNGKRIREVYTSEMDAAMAYDYYARKNGINVNKLNFKETDISTKPTENQLRKHKSNEKNRNPK